MSKAATKPYLLPDIPGLENLEKPEPKSRRIVGPFFSDQKEKITRLAQGIRTRHKLGTLFIAPDGTRGAFSIYKRRVA